MNSRRSERTGGRRNAVVVYTATEMGPLSEKEFIIGKQRNIEEIWRMGRIFSPKTNKGASVFPSKAGEETLHIT